jgi:hypothetical protein
MQVIRLYDPGRALPQWRDHIGPGQFAAFSTCVDTGAACDADGAVFPSPDLITCAIFDSLESATEFCRARVERTPGVRFDIFDSAGRTQPPLQTVVHPSRTPTLEGNPRSVRTSTAFGILLLIAAPFLLWFDWAKHDGILVLPTIVAINCVLIAVRIFTLNASYTAAERARRTRLASYVERDPEQGRSPGFARGGTVSRDE